MNRRDFMKFGALALSPILIKYLNDWTQGTVENDFEIEILSDAAVGPSGPSNTESAYSQMRINTPFLSFCKH